MKTICHAAGSRRISNGVRLSITRDREDPLFQASLSRSVRAPGTACGRPRYDPCGRPSRSAIYASAQDDLREIWPLRNRQATVARPRKTERRDGADHRGRHRACAFAATGRPNDRRQQPKGFRSPNPATVFRERVRLPVPGPRRDPAIAGSRPEISVAGKFGLHAGPIVGRTATEPSPVDRHRSSVRQQAAADRRIVRRLSAGFDPGVCAQEIVPQGQRPGSKRV